MQHPSSEMQQQTPPARETTPRIERSSLANLANMSASSPALGAQTSTSINPHNSLYLESNTKYSHGFTTSVNQSFIHMLNTLSREENDAIVPNDSPDLATGDQTGFDNYTPRESMLRNHMHQSSHGDLSDSDFDLRSTSSLDAIHRQIRSTRKSDQLRQVSLDDEFSLEESLSVEIDEIDASHTSTNVRRAKLADKLADIFSLDEEEQVIAEYQCWLFMSIPLQGFLYLTTGHLCFYAYLPKKEGAVIRSEQLSIRGKTHLYYKHWFSLKDDVLSWYASASDPYFPSGHIDLHYCISVEPSRSNKNHFKLSTSKRTWFIGAEKESSRDEWVKLLKKVMFQCQNESESVKIAIPLETVLNIDKSSHLEFASTIHIKVQNPEEGGLQDEYWFSNFKDIENALSQMKGVWDVFKQDNPAPPSSSESITSQDWTLTRSSHARTGSKSSLTKAAGWSSLTSKLRRFTPTGIQTDLRTRSPSPPPLSAAEKNAFDNEEKRLKEESSKPSPFSPNPLNTTDSSSSKLYPPPRSWEVEPKQPTWKDKLEQGGISIPGTRPLEEGHSYPPASPVNSPPNPNKPLPIDVPKKSGNFMLAASSSSSGTLPSTSASSVRLMEGNHKYPPATGPDVASPVGSWNMSHMASIASSSLSSMPDWLKSQPRKLLEVATPVLPKTTIGRRISEVVSSARLPMGHKQKAVTGEESHEPQDEEELDDSVQEKFKTSFGLSEKEKVTAHFRAFLFRGIPVYGKIYISTSFFCFRSVGLSNSLLPKTKMVLPLSDILAVSKHRSFQFGYSGLILVIRGHEELFFEFQNSPPRDKCLKYVEERIELFTSLEDKQNHVESPEQQQHRELLGLAESIRDNETPIMLPGTPSKEEVVKPAKVLRFTFLTIGSRGDVQPYIALCKGLLADGHICKIASHGEYRAWVEGHGILFEEVGGDPGELMRLMIAHDFFTISFMKEAVTKFRGWLDELLESSWKACQGTDVLVESPSAIAGFHIAEALRIPYFRAFTMPWSRTRAYPHAFAVPDEKLGGNYNFMSYTMFDHIFWRATAGQINRWRKKSLGLRSTSLDLMQQHKIPFLYNFSPVIVPPPLDWRENIVVTGYWWLDNPDDSNAKKWEPPSDLVAFIKRGRSQSKKIIFIGFGSIIIPDPEGMTRIVAEAVEQADVYAVIAKGWSDRAPNKTEHLNNEETELRQQEMLNKECIYTLKSIPHDWLFPQIDAAVHHGGAGTTGASLRAGLPTIIRPFFGDQHFYADRVATLGIGSAVRDLTVDNFATAIVTAVTDEKQISRAKQTGEAIRKERGVERAIEFIYREMDYAISNIPAPPSSNETGHTLLKPLKFGRSQKTSRKEEESPARSEHRVLSDTDHDHGWDVLSGELELSDAFETVGWDPTYSDEDNTAGNAGYGSDDYRNDSVFGRSDLASSRSSSTGREWIK